MSDWENYNFEDKLKNILLQVNYKPNPQHHFGKPFLSSYQLAIEFDKSFHNDVIAMGYVIGGKGANVKTSLAQYIGRELSRNIKNGSIRYIEGGFFSNKDLSEIIFNYENGIVSSATDGIYDLSMFRIKEYTKVAIKAIEMGMDNETISQLTGLTSEEMDILRNRD